MLEDCRFRECFAGLEPSSTLRINEAANQLLQKGEDVFHMGFGESRFEVHPRLQAALADNAHKKSYLAAKGLPTLVEAVSDYYSEKLGLPFKASQVVVGPGSKQLIYSLQLILDADVFLPAASWVSYQPQASLVGSRCSIIESSSDKDFYVNLANLDEQINASTNPCKLLIINSPNNPTGEVWPDSLLKELADYCRAKQIWVISDEIYFQVCHGDRPHRSIANYYPEGTIVLGGLSKQLSIGGWRLGVALLPNTSVGLRLLEKLVIVGTETWSGVCAPVQYAAIEAYKQHDDIEAFVSDCTSIHGIRTRYLKRELETLGVECSDAKGAFYLLANFGRYRAGLANIGVTDSVQLANWLFDEFRIATLPGSDFSIPLQSLSLRLSTSYLDMEGEADSTRLMRLFRKGVSEEEFMCKTNHPKMNRTLALFKEIIVQVS